MYRGRPARSWEAGPSYQQRYHGREVIRPLEIPSIHPLAEDTPPIVDDGESSLSSSTEVSFMHKKPLCTSINIFSLTERLTCFESL